MFSLLFLLFPMFRFSWKQSQPVQTGFLSGAPGMAWKPEQDGIYAKYASDQ